MNKHNQSIKEIEELFRSYMDLQEKVFNRPEYYFEEEIPLIKSVITHCYIVLTTTKKEEE